MMTFLAMLRTGTRCALPALVLGILTCAVPGNGRTAVFADVPLMGADLGVASGFALADTVPECGAGMVSAQEVAACPAAVQQHKLIFTWHFDAESCASHPCNAPDGFNLIRQDSNGTATFQTAAGTDRGAILPIQAVDVAGSCFYVVPFRGASDFGKKSNPVCITIDEKITLAPISVSVAHAYSDTSSTFGTSPSSNPVGYTIAYKQTQSAGPNFTVGWVDRASVSGVAAVSDYTDFFQGLVTFDITKIPRKTIKKATFTAVVARSAINAGGLGSTYNGSEDSAPRSCAASVGFPNNYSEGGSVPAVVDVSGTTALTPGLTSTLSIDVTNMVRAWLGPQGVNNGLVLTGRIESKSGLPNTYNSECITLYSQPRLTVVLDNT